MLKTKLKDWLAKIIEKTKSAIAGKRLSFSFDVLMNKTLNFLTSWWHILTIGLALIIFLYYPLGGFLVSNIDRNTTYEIDETHPEQSSTVEMISFLINREVNEKIWTPNLPFFYPSYFLDNMPSFQLGMFDALSKFSSSFAKRIDKKIVSEEEQSDLQAAAELLRYPGTVWMFSAENKLLLAPSANNQYRKARRHLIHYNQNLSLGTETFYKTPADLAYLLNKSRINLAKSTATLDAQIREESSSWIDTKADNVFYYQQGKAYAYFLLFKALANDYQDIIVAADQYRNWISVIKALEDASSIQPLIVRNGELSSLTAPNHLSYLDMYISKAQNLMAQIAQTLNNLKQ